ncbi:MAG: hypothetical protein GQ524_09695, partial [Anaerolineales bacterium]|nr:hypothetical protein [Anaerolineales bacterium]
RRSISRTSSSVMRAPSTFNVPVAGALFTVEIILGESGVSQFSPIVISSVTATVQARIDLLARYRQWAAVPSAAARCIGGHQQAGSRWRPPGTQRPSRVQPRPGRA